MNTYEKIIAQREAERVAEERAEQRKRDERNAQLAKLEKLPELPPLYRWELGIHRERVGWRSDTKWLFDIGKRANRFTFGSVYFQTDGDIEKPGWVVRVWLTGDLVSGDELFESVDDALADLVSSIWKMYDDGVID